MQLAVGDRILCEFPPMGDRFVGVVTDSDVSGGMMAYVAAPPRASDRVAPGCAATVMFAREGRLLGFRARVLEAQKGSGLTVNLETLGETEVVDMRRETRVPCAFPAEVENGSGSLTGFIMDISDSAVRMRMEIGVALPEAGAEALLRFRVFSAGDVYETPCRVFRSFVRETVPHLILEYDKPDETFRRAVHEFIEFQRQSGKLNAV